jgi:hypothetical protein
LEEKEEEVALLASPEAQREGGRMVASSAGATCLATVSLPPAARHCQAVQAIAAFQTISESHKTMATMSAAAAVVDQLRQQLLLVVGKVRVPLLAIIVHILGIFQWK